MRPIMLHGHERPLTQIKYNREGDLLFSVAKDNTPNLWYSHNGERVGTYVGHNGTVWSCDVNFDSMRLLTGSADNSVKLWDVSTGKCLSTLVTNTAVRCVQFATGDREFLMVTDARMGFPCQMMIVPISNNQSITAEAAKQVITITGSKITAASWGPLNELIYTCHENGEISTWDAATGEKLDTVKEHDGPINDMQWSNDHEYFITACKDKTAKIFDAETLQVIRTFSTDRPVNSAALSPLKEHMMLGGGQEAASVTTTSMNAGKFEVAFHDRITSEELGRVKGHFGPINTVAFHPDGRSFASGGEDGFIRIHHFDKDYFSFKMEYGIPLDVK